MVGSFQKAEKIVPLIRSSISGPTRQNAPRSRKRTRCFPQVRPPSVLLCTRTSVSWPKSVMLSHRRWQTATTVPRLVASSPGSRTPKPFPGVKTVVFSKNACPDPAGSGPENRPWTFPAATAAPTPSGLKKSRRCIMGLPTSFCRCGPSLLRARKEKRGNRKE